MRFFGTDGIRGIFGQSPITLPEIKRLGKALSTYLGSNSHVLIGYDTRSSSPLILEALCQGLSGIHVYTLGTAPTPAVAYLTRRYRADLGIVISASHNPALYNGLKFFNRLGEKFSLEEEKSLEHCLSLVENVDICHQMPCIPEELPLGPYQKALQGLASSLHTMKVVIDCAHGAFSDIAASVFQECGAQVRHLLGTQPSGMNINEDVGSLHPRGLQRAVLEYGADLGIAFDGDGDRVLLIDEQGRTHDGDQIIAALSLMVPTEGIVGTVMSNWGLEHFFNCRSLPFIRTDVGDRFVAHEMKRHGWKLGGESCGHIVLGHHLMTGDGCAAALSIADFLAKEKRRASDLFPLFPAIPHMTYNVPIRSCSHTLLQDPSWLSHQGDIQDALKDKGRILVRPSGTEPLIRILLESSCIEQIKPLAQRLVDHLIQLDDVGSS